MEKKMYYCDYCGKECVHTPHYNMPTIEAKEEWATDSNGNKIKPFYSREIKAKQVDICSSCQIDIARILNLMKYVRLNPDDLENDVYVALSKAK